MYKSIEDLAIGRCASARMTTRTELFSTSLTDLRKASFPRVHANIRLSPVAEESMVIIEKLRDDHGRPDDDPRHPDIDAGHAWPLSTQQHSERG